MKSHLQTSLGVLNRKKPIEIVLTIDSFAGGENTVDEIQAMKLNEARQLENWDALSLGGMIRAPGFNQVGSGGASYSAAADLLLHHVEGTTKKLYGIIAGDLVILNGSTIAQEDAAAFTSGVLSHGFSHETAYAWITNATDNLKRKQIGVAIATPASQPATACARVYQHKLRMLAEGSSSQGRRIYGSRTGVGNWTAADAWSLANDAFNIDLPDDTRGLVPGFPSGDEVLAFTRFAAYSLYNFPNVAFRPFPQSRGCEAPYSIALGDEGVYFVSRYPTLGIFLMLPTGQFVELTEKNRDVFVEKIDFTRRIFGIYRNKKYHLFYNETGSGATYPNKWRIYDTRFGRWMDRPVATGLSDNFGYPALLTKDSNQLYAASSRSDLWYELEIGTDDEGNDTRAVYKTKDFTSVDFKTIEGGPFPIDNCRLKLVKVTAEYYGTVGSLGVQWEADRGKYSGSKTFDLTGDGDKINTTFIVNTSKIISSPPDRVTTLPFPNSAIGQSFAFTFTNSGQGDRGKLKKIKIHAIVYEEL